MPWAVSGIELGKVRAIVLLAVLLVTGLGAPRAEADATTPQPSAADTMTPPDSGQNTTNTVITTQTATATGGAGGTATGGDAGPAPAPEGGSQGGDAYANGGSAQAQNSLENERSNQPQAADDALDQISAAKPRQSRPVARRTHHTRSPARSGSVAAGDVTRSGTKGSRGHETGKTDSGSDVPGHGGLPTPDEQQHPFFSLLSAPGGAGAGLTLLLLAVLGAAIALPRERSRVFRPPTVPWRPLAYVPPIELPG